METIYMSKRLKYSASIAILFWLFIQLISAAEPISKKDFERKISESYKISSDGQVTLLNKYGEIKVETWDKNQVDIDVTIQVDAKNQEKANEIFDRIKINFDHGSDFVKAVTELNSKKKSWWSWSDGSGGKFTINYYVRMPASCELDVTNKYGNVLVDELLNDCDLVVKYGNFTVGKIDGDFNFQLGYGNGRLDQGQDVVGAIKYGKLALEKIGDLNIMSKYSQIRIEEAKEVKSESKYDGYDIGVISELRNEGKYDHFDIESVEELDIITKYTDVDVKMLKKEAQFEMGYGGVKIHALTSSFSGIEATGKYTSFKINVANIGTANFDLNTEYGDIKLPGSAELKYESDQSNSSRKKGHIGSSNDGAEIIITTKYGSIKLFE